MTSSQDDKLIILGWPNNTPFTPISCFAASSFFFYLKSGISPQSVFWQNTDNRKPEKETVMQLKFSGWMQTREAALLFSAPISPTIFHVGCLLMQRWHKVSARASSNNKPFFFFFTRTTVICGFPLLTFVHCSPLWTFFFQQDFSLTGASIGDLLTTPVYEKYHKPDCA